MKMKWNKRHISHCCLVPAISSHGVTHCARCRLVCFIFPPRMHAVFLVSLIVTRFAHNSRGTFVILFFALYIVLVFGFRRVLSNSYLEVVNFIKFPFQRVL